jgi:hypothetical protein
MQMSTRMTLHLPLPNGIRACPPVEKFFSAPDSDNSDFCSLIHRTLNPKP